MDKEILAFDCPIYSYGPASRVPFKRHWRGAMWPCPVVIFERDGRQFPFSVWAHAKNGLDPARVQRIADALRATVVKIDLNPESNP